jgi:precorrin-6A/cobalt-precorrin-6A reductase
MRILILGGTTEARELAERLSGHAGVAVTLSFAGRTAAPAAVPVAVRVGGFGGVAGLTEYLAVERIDVLIDATHPFAAQISAHAAQAATAAGVRVVAVRRPPWIAQPGDNWTDVATMPEAVVALGEAPRRVFLALGRKELAPFVAAPHHFYLVRSVDPVVPRPALPRAEYITARGPFSEADERALLAEHRIEIVVAKNSGGAAVYGKIAAARALGIAVVMLRRPELPPVPSVAGVEDAMAWLAHAGLPCAARGV